MTDEPRRDEPADEPATRGELLALRGEVEDRDLRQQRELGRVRQQLRELAAQVEGLHALLKASPAQPWTVLDAQAHEKRVGSVLYGIRRRLALRTRLRAVARWVQRVGRAIVGRDEPPRKGEG